MEINYSKLKRKKILQVGGKSRYVWLMEKDIIKKTYHRNQPKQLRRFINEVKLMKHLSDCPFVPDILHIDPKNCAIFMNYVGRPLKDTLVNRRKLAAQMKKLHLDWNLMRQRNGKPNYNVYIGNGTIMRNQVYVIDFGSFHYRITGPKVIISN